VKGTPTTRIRKLPDHLVNKIAAGEVVERPASAVKELVENALDAEARTITVELRDGGGALIRVTDDGTGMTEAELPLALERHATSKLDRDEDLDAIATLGFRGEALPAICAVSRFTITSRPRGRRQSRARLGSEERGRDAVPDAGDSAPERREDAPEGRADAPEGLRVEGEGGRITHTLRVPVDAGTTVEVRDLFFNTPARLKFLKSTATEVAASLRALTQLGLAHPEVHLRVTSNGRTVMALPAAGDLRQRLGASWSYDVASRLLAVDRTEHGVTLHGFASPPDLTRGGRDEIIVTVNARPVRDPALMQAILEAYRPLLKRDRFPMVCLSIAMAPADVDVNVHPTKAWVRFRHPRLVQEMVLAAVGEALRRDAVVPRLSPFTGASDDAPTSWGTGAARTEPVASGQEALFAEPAGPYGAAALFGQVLGQVQQTFVVTSSDEEVFFLDQHVAHERVLYERLEDELRAGRPASQTLLFPEPLDLAPAARALLERWRAPLERLGFVLDGFGGQALVVRAVPVLLKGDEPRRLIEAAVDDLGGSKAGEPAVERALAFVACRAAVKAGAPLVREEMERLVKDLGRTRTPFFCPHGRPIVSRISIRDIRRELKRNW
jgi:DNA mismatch repair protein MutL